MKIIFLITCLTVLLGCSSGATKKYMKEIKIGDVPNLKKPVYEALAGRVDKTLLALDKVNQKKLSNKESKLIDKYKNRFGNVFQKNTVNESLLVNELVGVYHRYWYRGLLNKQPQMEGVESVFNSLKTIAATFGYSAGDFSEDEMNKLEERIQKELKKEGYFSLLGGVKPFLNLMIWKKESVESYKIDLGDTRQEVEVVMMDDFVVLGWAGYATFNVFHVGGWAKKDRLYCVKPSYDLDSENFKISYLAHEGRHFADYKKYPKIDGVNLEYRAKLTELILADESFSVVLDKFISEAKDDPKNSHAYASFLLVRNLSTSSKSMSDLSQVPKNITQENAKKLLNQHSNALDSLGADHVKTVF